MPTTFTVSSGSERVVEVRRGTSSGRSGSIHSPTSSNGRSFSTDDSWSDLGDDIEPSDSASRSRHPPSRRHTTEVRPAPQRRTSSRRVPLEREEDSPPPTRRRATHTSSRHRRAESRRTPSDESASVASYEDYPFGHHGGAPQPPPRAPYPHPSGYRHVPAPPHGGYPPSVSSAQYTDPYAAQQALVHMQGQDPFGYQANPFAPQSAQQNPFSPMSSAGGTSYFPESHAAAPQHHHRPGPPQRPQSFVAPSHYGSELAISPYPYSAHPGMGMPPYGYPAMPGQMPGWPYPAPPPAPSHTSSPAPPPEPKVNAELEALKAQFAEENDKLKAHLQSKDEAEKAKAAEDYKKLQEMVKKYEQAAAAAEAAAIAKKAEEEAEKKKKAEIAEAEKKAKEGAEKKAEEAAKKAKDEHEKKLAEAKKAQEEAEKKQKELEEAVKKNAPLPDSDKLPIKFKDAVGRTFSFPWHICKTWKGMETLIRQAFMHIEGLGEHVMAGHYDLQGPDGEIILPQVWETVVKPDWTISMHTWPMPEAKEEKREEIHYGGHGGDPLADLFGGMGFGPQVVEPKKSKKGKDGKKKKATSPIIDVPPPAPGHGHPHGAMPPPPNFPPGIFPPDPLAGFPGMEPLVMDVKDSRRPAKASSKTKGSKDISPLTAWMIGGGSRSSKKDDEKLDLVRRRSVTSGSSRSGGSGQQGHGDQVACTVM